MEDQLQRVESRGSLLKKDEKFEAVVFTSRKFPSKRTHIGEKQGVQNTPPEFDIKQATKEVIKLGAKGFYSRRRDRTLKSLAIELGAKPEKKRYHNYKELKDIRNKNREKREERLSMMEKSTAHHLKLKYARNHPKKLNQKSGIDILKNYGKLK